MCTMQKGKKIENCIFGWFPWLEPSEVSSSYKLAKRVMLKHSLKSFKHKWIKDLTRHIQTQPKSFILKQNITHDAEKSFLQPNIFFWMYFTHFFQNCGSFQYNISWHQNKVSWCWCLQPYSICCPEKTMMKKYLS